MEDTFVKIRLGNEKTAYDFASRDEAFQWVRKNCNHPMMISVLLYEKNSMSRMDRYYFDKNKQFSMENVLS